MSDLTDEGAIQEALAATAVSTDPYLAGAGASKRIVTQAMAGTLTNPTGTRLTSRGDMIYRGANATRARLIMLLSDGNTVADYQPGNYTGTLNASAWANSIGAAGSLLQATGANQPIILSSDYVKKAWFPGVTGNNFSTPDSAALQTLTGSMDVDACIEADDWTPAALTYFLAKDLAAKRSFAFGLNSGSTGALSFEVYDTAGGVGQFVSSVAPTVSDGGTLWVRAKCTWALAGNIKVDFYTSPDGSTWSALGTQQTKPATGNAVGQYNNALYIGQRQYIAVPNPFLGKMFSARVYSGDRAAGGTLVANWNASDWSETSTNGATQVSSTTGETWTLNNTGAKLAQIVATPQLLFDGAAHFLKAASFTFAQPELVLIVGKPISWTSGDDIFDGDVSGRMLLRQTGVTPSVSAFAGTFFGANTNWTVGQYSVFAAYFAGASPASFTQVDSTAAVTGSSGAANADGFTLGSAPAGNTNWSNIQVKEVILRTSSANLSQIQSLLKALHGTP